MTTATIGSQLRSGYSTAIPGAQQKVRPDCDIQVDAERTIRQDAVLRGTTDLVDVLVNGSIVYLSGYVATTAHKARAESDVRRVEGVERVQNYLHSDEELQGLVAEKLTRDADLSHCLLEVRSTQGFIRLDGQVDNSDLANAAVRLAGSVAGVRAVINRLHSPGATAARADERVLVPGIGQDVYASDGRLGRVERMVLDACNRCVTAIAVDAHFGMWPEYIERHILIPIACVRSVNATGVELNITAAEAARCLDFDLKAFVMPDVNTQPPYGYLYGQVLLESAGRA
jgi:osmotically-inducible protein OsmY